MVKQILQQLLEHQAFMDAVTLSVRLRQPLTVVENELKALNEMCPGLLMLQYDGNTSLLRVRIAEHGEDLAKKLLSR